VKRSLWCESMKFSWKFREFRNHLNFAYLLLSEAKTVRVSLLTMKSLLEIISFSSSCFTSIHRRVTTHDFHYICSHCDVIARAEVGDTPHLNTTKSSDWSRKCSSRVNHLIRTYSDAQLRWKQFWIDILHFFNHNGVKHMHRSSFE